MVLTPENELSGFRYSQLTERVLPNDRGGSIVGSGTVTAFLLAG